MTVHIQDIQVRWTSPSPSRLAWFEGRPPFGATLHSSDKRAYGALESVVCPCYGAIEIVVVIIIDVLNVKK